MRTQPFMSCLSEDAFTGDICLETGMDLLNIGEPASRVPEQGRPEPSISKVSRSLHTTAGDNSPYYHGYFLSAAASAGFRKPGLWCPLVSLAVTEYHFRLSN